MKFTKLTDIEASIDDDRQTPAGDDFDDEDIVDPEKSFTSLTLSKKTPSPIKTDDKRHWDKERVVKTLNYIKTCLILYGTFFALIALNIHYFEINQVCPYNTDFDCLYRYLVCEGDCSDLWKPLVEKDFDFYRLHVRKDGFFFNTRLAHIISKLIIIAFVFSIIMTLGIFKKGARVYILIVAINVYYLKNYRDGDQHGDYTYILGNSLTTLIKGLVGFFSFVIIAGRINSRGKGYAWAVFVTITAMIAFALYGIVHRVTSTCDNWDKGLYSERIDNNVNCQFSKPSFCMYEFIGDFYDYNKWLQVTCADRKPHWDLMDEKYPDTARLGFPLMRGMTKGERQFNNVTNYVYKNLKEVTDENEKDFEIVLHRTFDGNTASYRGPAWFEINVQFNQELVAQRSKLVSESLADNVLVLYIDTLSRAAAFRSLPETMKVFEQMTPKMHQFFKYHSIGPYTLANMYPMYYGIPRPRTTVPSGIEAKSFIHQYKDKGFITGRALSHCALSALNTASDYMYYNQIDEEPFDHMGNGWACDINFKPKILNEATTGPMSVLQRCVYGKEISEYVIDYGKKFWNTYKDQKKFLWLDFLDFHDHTASHGKYLDQYLSKFLSEMDLKDTMLMLVSDHGQHVYKNAAFWKFKSGEIERAAPALFVKLPEKLESVYGEGLEGNKQQIVQAFDLNKLWNAIPNPILAKDTILHKLPPKSTGCDFAFRDQECQCQVPNK